MSSLEEDPKEVAKKERRSPEVERLLKQFRSIESCNANTAVYVEEHARIFADKCLDCDGFGTIGVAGKYTRSEEKCPSCDGTGKKVPPVVSREPTKPFNPNRCVMCGAADRSFCGHFVGGGAL